MEVKYHIESKYYNGDSYADFAYSLSDVADMLIIIEQQDNDSLPDAHRIDSKQVTVTTEEQ